MVILICYGQYTVDLRLMAFVDQEDQQQTRLTCDKIMSGAATQADVDSSARSARCCPPESMQRVQRSRLRLVHFLYSHTFQNSTPSCTTHLCNKFSFSVVSTPLVSARKMASAANGTEHVEQFDLVTIGAGALSFEGISAGICITDDFLYTINICCSSWSACISTASAQ